MDDLISRQVAIDALNEANEAGVCWRGGYEQRRNDFQEAIDCINDLPTAQKWIPCSERLPEPEVETQMRGWFITSNQYGGVSMTCYEFENSPFKKGWQTDMRILAWMPLPEPYKGVE